MRFKSVFRALLTALFFALFIYPLFTQDFNGTNFSSDKPYYGTPPYHYEGCQVYFIVVKTNPDVIQSLLPENLVPISDGVITFTFAKFNIVTPFQFKYIESYFSIPVSYGKLTGEYQPVLYLNEIESILPGREIWGYNKTLADIKIEENKSTVNITIRRMDTTIINASFVLKDTMPVQENTAPSYMFFHKYIPSVEKDKEPEVNQLTLGEITDSETSLYRLCTATIELNKTQYDPFNKIPVLGIISAGYLENSFTLDYGKILCNYKDEK